MRLTYTYLRSTTAAGWSCRTSGSRRARSRTTRWWTRASRWRCRCGFAPSADADRALELIAAEEDGVSAAVAEVEQGRRAPERHDLGGRRRGSAGAWPRSCAHAGCAGSASTVYPQPEAS